jgi:hypothetical protein
MWARVAEGGETILFKENFSDFPGQLMITSKPEGHVGGSTGVKKEQLPVDIGKMLRGEPRPPEWSVLYDDGSGFATVCGGTEEGGGGRRRKEGEGRGRSCEGGQSRPPEWSMLYDDGSGFATGRRRSRERRGREEEEEGRRMCNQ